MNGRYPYIKYEKNIGLPKGKQPEDITKEQAIELINAKK